MARETRPMEGFGVSRASRTALTVLAVGPALAVLAVVRALPALDLGASDLGWVLVAVAVAVATAATAGGIVLLVAGLRDGSAASIAAAGASAALAGGAVGHIAGGQLDVPLAGAAAALLAAVLLDRREVTLGARSARVWAAVAAIVVAEALVLTELLPAVAAGVDPARTVTVGVAIVMGLAASLIALGGRLELAAIGLTDGVIGVALDRGDGLEL
ncbi:MAG TPA: hypothetical protein VHP64_04690, partial [Candidatus Limnocylindria bacterium]|nr:hypothetical protein [Candidatus Limnocylindria bacterium]